MSDDAIALALDLIREWEGCRLEAYPDPGTGGDPWTVGWGATGPGIGPGTRWTQEQADEALAEHVGQVADAVAGMVRVPLAPPQAAALISWVYNVGAGAARRSTLVRRLNAGDYDAVPAQLARWNRAGGRVMRGLTNRRAAEAEMWSRG